MNMWLFRPSRKSSIRTDANPRHLGIRSGLDDPTVVFFPSDMTETVGVGIGADSEPHSVSLFTQLLVRPFPEVILLVNTDMPKKSEFSRKHRK